MIAVLGANGQLGSAFMRHLGSSARPVTREELDLRDTKAIGAWVTTSQPQAIINCAAFTDVEGAESDEDTAMTVNATAVGELARASLEIGARLVTFSTDYVFDGTKDDPYLESDKANPLNVYGMSKRKGEALALETYPSVLVVRTSWLMSPTHPNFLTTIVERLKRGGPVDVVDDQHGSPTFVDDLVVATMAAIEAGADGILHLTNGGETTWFGLAHEVRDLLGLPPDVVRPVHSFDLGLLARRPANSLLRSSRFQGLGLSEAPHYSQSLKSVLARVAVVD